MNFSIFDHCKVIMIALAMLSSQSVSKILIRDRYDEVFTTWGGSFGPFAKVLCDNYCTNYQLFLDNSMSEIWLLLS